MVRGGERRGAGGGVDGGEERQEADVGLGGKRTEADGRTCEVPGGWKKAEGRGASGARRMQGESFWRGRHGRDAERDDAGGARNGRMRMEAAEPLVQSG
jgi:hypothetical protein